jgi:DNA-binding MarR family transcriptional regulator
MKGVSIMNEKTAAIMLFFDISHKVKSIMRKNFEEMGITMPQGMVIGLLHKNNEMTVSEISTEMGLSNSTVSGILDRLEKNNYIIRKRSNKDKRIVNIMLSSEFIKKHKDFHKNFKSVFESIMDKSPKEETKKILEGLDSLKKILDRIP